MCSLLQFLLISINFQGSMSSSPKFLVHLAVHLPDTIQIRCHRALFPPRPIKSLRNRSCSGPGNCSGRVSDGPGSRLGREGGGGRERGGGRQGGGRGKGRKRGRRGRDCGEGWRRAASPPGGRAGERTDWRKAGGRADGLPATAQ